MLLPFLKDIPTASSVPLPPASETKKEESTDDTEQERVNLPNKEPPLFSILKLSARGLVGLKLQTCQEGSIASAQHALHAALAVYENNTNLEADKPSLQHVQRIVPISSTCVLEVEALKACTKRVAPFVAELFKSTPDQPTTFGIGLNNRHNSDGSNISIDRMEIVKAVASSLSEELKERHDITVSVDLLNIKH